MICGCHDVTALQSQRKHYALWRVCRAVLSGQPIILFAELYCLWINKKNCLSLQFETQNCVIKS